MSAHYFVVVSKKDNWMAHFSLVYSLTLSFESTFRFIIFFLLFMVHTYLHYYVAILSYSCSMEYWL